MLTEQDQSNKNKTGDDGMAYRKGDESPPSISLPRGGGAIKGIGEKFSVNSVTGTGSLSIPIYTTPGRSGFSPHFSLAYDSGTGNSPFGLGWNISLPSIARKTEKRLPRYLDEEDSDIFILSASEDLVPSLTTVTDQVLDNEIYSVRRYRPRIEGLFARVERWKHKASGDVHWRSVSKENVTSVYGKRPDSKNFDPSDQSRVFTWLIEESFDDKGNIITYEYKRENADNVDHSLPQEKNRLVNQKGYANCYLKYVRYGNRIPHRVEEDQWAFIVVFDYGEHGSQEPSLEQIKLWPTRSDPFSTFRAGFDIRTHRLCRRVLMFHHFQELDKNPSLVRSTDIEYEEGPVASFIKSITQSGYIKDKKSKTTEKKSLPPVEFTYTKAVVDDELRFVDAESLENLPAGLDGAQYQWVDLYSEGLSGVLTETTGAWFYKHNLGGAKFAPAQLLATNPSIADLRSGRQQIMDLAGDGRKYLVQFDGPLHGYYALDEDGSWETYTPFQSVPNISWNDSNLKFIDLSGDGLPDLILSENDVFVWYQSLAGQGFGAAEIVPKPDDEGHRPALVFADSTQSIYVSDMSGDGLSDIVRIRNGEVCYWPNLGYGRFGSKVTMGHAPVFDRSEQFNQRQIRLADVDGSGTTDIIYLSRDGATFWLNQSGNSWSDPHHLGQFPFTDNLSSVMVVDLLGTGTSCIVWSSPLPGDATQPMRFIDLMSEGKPYLMQSVKNNMGAETWFSYAPSTRFYLQDMEAGTPWIARLPFPVHVVECVETYDRITVTKLVTRYRYHHGFYDGVEREFRGFGMVEQEDAESFGHFKDSGSFNIGQTAATDELSQPTVRTLTWFHTGAYLDEKRISGHYAEEYYEGDSEAIDLSDTALPSGLTLDEEREAARALKGQLLHREVYAFDDSPLSKHPYQVSQRNYGIELLQPKLDGSHAVFSVHPLETIDYHYERREPEDPDGPADPRISHQMTIEADKFGNVLKSAMIAYPRRKPAGQGRALSGHAKTFPEQQKTFITYTENSFFNQENELLSWYRAGIPVESRVYEITDPSPVMPYFLQDVLDKKLFQNALEIQYENPATSERIEKRLVEHVRSLYYKNNLSGPLPLSAVESLALPFKQYKMAFTPGLLVRLYGDRVTDSLLKEEGRYVQSKDLMMDGLFKSDDRESTWWIPSGHQDFDKEHFFLPVKYTDPFGEEFFTGYDAPHFLLVATTEDPLQNRAQAVHDYRVMMPSQITDANLNRSQASFDALGVVVAMAIMGNGNEGDTLEDPTTRFEYELFNFMLKGKPNFVHTFARVLHGPSNKRFQETLSYSDGFGREVMKKVQAEPGLAQKLDERGDLVTVDTTPNVRWVGTGRTVYNNKGKPVKQYEPYFSATHDFEDEKEMVEQGVTPLLRYDPLDRLIRTDHPDGTFTKVEFDAWKQTTWDENDTVLESLWLKKLLPTFDPAHLPSNPNAGQRAAIKASKHAGTPTVVHLDTLGRVFLTIADNGNNERFKTSVELDIEGNRRALTDARAHSLLEHDATASVQNLHILEQDFDMLGRAVYTRSGDSGERRVLPDIAGKPISSFDKLIASSMSASSDTLTTNYNGSRISSSGRKATRRNWSSALSTANHILTRPSHRHSLT